MNAMFVLLIPIILCLSSCSKKRKNSSELNTTYELLQENVALPSSSGLQTINLNLTASKLIDLSKSPVTVTAIWDDETPLKRASKTCKKSVSSAMGQDQIKKYFENLLICRVRTKILQADCFAPSLLLTYLHPISSVLRGAEANQITITSGVDECTAEYNLLCGPSNLAELDTSLETEIGSRDEAFCSPL